MTKDMKQTLSFADLYEDHRSFQQKDQIRQQKDQIRSALADIAVGYNLCGEKSIELADKIMLAVQRYETCYTMVQEDTTIGVPNVDGFDLSWIRGGMTPESREFDVLEDQLSWPILYAEKQEASTEVSSDILAQGTCRLQISVPNLVEDPSMPVMSDMDALYRALEPYQILQMSFAMEDVFVGDPVGRWLEQIDGGYITSNTGLKNGIEAVFGESVRVYSDGYISPGDLTWYSAADTNTFASYGVTQ